MDMVRKDVDEAFEAENQDLNVGTLLAFFYMYTSKYSLVFVQNLGSKQDFYKLMCTRDGYRNYVKNNNAQ